MERRERRTSQRITNAALLQAAGVEENRVILLSGQLIIKTSGVVLGNISTGRLHRCHKRFYHKTEEGYYIFDTGAHNGFQREAEAEDPEPEYKAIKLYYYSGRLFLQTKNGALAEDDTILNDARE